MNVNSNSTKRAKELRQSQTKAEGLLWSILRSKQLCGLKFRRQHPIEPYFADFACLSHKLVVELDGDYHDHIQDADLDRQRELENRGWKVLRFSNDDVLEDAEAVAHSIAQTLKIPYSFRKRNSAPSGMLSRNAPHQ